MSSLVDRRDSMELKPSSWMSPFIPRIHNCGEVICQLENSFYDSFLPFRSQEQRQLFLAMDMPRYLTLAFPEAPGYRLIICERLFSLLTYLDDVFDRMEKSEGRALYDDIQRHVLEEKCPLKNTPWSTFLLGLIVEMETIDACKGRDVLNSLSVYLSARTGPIRSNDTTFAAYLDIRESGLGTGLIREMLKWSMDISIPPEECSWLQEVEKNFSDHIAIVNDLFSWDKELLTSQNCQGKMGGDLFNSVSVLMRERDIDVHSAQTYLARMVPGIEARHFDLISKRREYGNTIPPEVMRYVRSMEDLLAGNELFHRLSGRYHKVDEIQRKPVNENIGFRALI